jgi:predicted metal-dependent hydrolase
MEMWKSIKEFKQAVYIWANKVGVKIASIKIEPMGKKWGECVLDTNKGAILRFNTQLMGMDRTLGEYTILHEVLHANVPNHGILWKSLMSAYMNDWQDRDTQLKKKV